ncbi:transporter substrate-binding domain-containing protein [Pseudoalteromonas sp.]|uniref:transporter substrate-binding domain-containing protein n=1 Tax=Pseudoalteromonas sp. TaxID=53249 RepID=UPI00272B6D0A|nr:transporter substrate-binding domain-containing protein [Pseudoalteromonas sp.]
MTVTLFFIRFLLVLFIVLSLHFQAKSSAPLPLTLCYADHTQAPLFVGAKHEIPLVEPTAQLAALAKLDNALESVTFKFVKMPWSQCITAIKQGRVDAFIAGFSPQKSRYAVFPVTDKGVPIAKFAFARMSQCLIGNRRFHTKWQSREVLQSKAFSLAVANGLFVGEAASEEAFFIEHTFTQQQAIERVSEGRADAALVLCQIENSKLDLSVYHRQKLAPVYPPLNTVTAYLAFSNEFYVKHQNEAVVIWQQLLKQNIPLTFAKQMQNSPHFEMSSYGAKE